MQLLLSVLLTGAALCSLPLQRTDAPHFRPKFIYGLCPALAALPADDAFVVGGQEWRARVFKFCTPLILTVPHFALF